MNKQSGKNILTLFLLFSHLIFLKSGFPQSSEKPIYFIIESISIEGNSKTNTDVIFENLSFGIGDTLSEDEIRLGIERLQDADIFKEVGFTPRIGSEAGKLHLIIKVKERYWPTFRFKGGFSEMDGWYLTPISLNMDNIFGFGNFTDLDITFGDRITSVNFNYINPNIFNSDFDLYFRIFLSNLQFVHYIDDGKLLQDVPQSGYFLGMRSREGFFKRFLLGWELYATVPDSFATAAGSKEKFYDFPEQIDKYVKQKWVASAFSVSFNWDERDNAAYPSRGWWLGMKFFQADKQIGSQVNFTRFIFDVRKYQRIFHKTVAAARLKFGIISNNAPFYEKFYLGGPNSLRGYADRSLSPEGGGDQIYQAGLELRFPISQKNYPKHFLTGVLFFDSGANLLADDKPEIESFKSSYGFGLRFRLPFISLLRMDFAYPVDGGEKMLQFSLGHTF
ncbi:MAG: BamA/TamA family outer membrane protein [Calditrichales bacterium]|nr:BamA/TamA family outer membrane protein [Calditrichales bacterium]